MSSQELERDEYDIVVVGTGLAESIAAAALAKAGKTVLHLDPNEYYAAAQASLTLDELAEWSARHSGSDTTAAGPSRLYSHATVSELTPELQQNRRRYALSLFPTVLPSRGELIDTLVKSDVSKYVSFRMLDSVSIANGETKHAEEAGPSVRLRRVPGSKEEVFKDKSASLMEKRRLMKFLMFAGGEFEQDEVLRGKEDTPLIQFLEEAFSLPKHLSTSVAYAIAHCTSPLDATLPALQRTRRYLRSVGRYGAGAFLVGQYGGAGEVAQGFCRACAVFGGTYVLGASAEIKRLVITDTGVELELPCHPRPVKASRIIATPQHLPDYLSSSTKSFSSIARCIALLAGLPPALKRERPLDEDGPDDKAEADDTAVVIFPPESADGHVVRGFMMGEGTGSCPAGQFVLYLNTPIAEGADPKATLEPFLHRLAPKPLYESYHTTHHHATEPSKSGDSRVVILSPYAGTEELTEGLDWEARQGQIAYEAVMGSGEDVPDFFEKNEDDAAEGQDEL